MCCCLSHIHWAIYYFIDYVSVRYMLAINFLLNINQGEIGRRSGGDNVLEREGYAVSAGFSLGLVALGMIYD